MTETADKRAAHRRGVTVTTVACLTGVAAGLVSNVLTGGGSAPVAAATETIGLVPLVAAFALNLGVVQVVGVDVSDFSTKDHLYTAFMTFALWFITWGLLLTAA